MLAVAVDRLALVAKASVPEGLLRSWWPPRLSHHWRVKGNLVVCLKSVWSLLHCSVWAIRGAAFTIWSALLTYSGNVHSLMRERLLKHNEKYHESELRLVQCCRKFLGRPAEKHCSIVGNSMEPLKRSLAENYCSVVGNFRFSFHFLESENFTCT